jgi:tetratricopeptide (TPR) repeat protein
MRMLVLLSLLAAHGGAATSPYQVNADALEHYREGRYVEAEAGFRRLALIWRDLGPPFERELAITGINLGTTLRVQARYAEAAPLLTASLSELERLSGAGSLDAARAASALAALYHAWGKLEEAEALAIRANPVLTRAPGATAADRADGLLTLASVYLRRQRAEAAQEVLAELSATGESRAAMRAYNDLAAVAIRRGDLDGAESFVRRALEMAPRVLPDGHPLRAAALNNLAQICRFRQRYAEAEQHYRAAIAIWESSVGPRHPDTAKGMLNLAALHHERGRERAAEELYRRAASVFREAYGDDHELTLIARSELAEVLRAERRYSESKRLSLETLPALETRLGPSDPRVTRALANYQRLVDESGRRP